MQTHANAGGDASETPRSVCTEGATKAKTECQRLLLALVITLCEPIKEAQLYCSNHITLN